MAEIARCVCGADGVCSDGSDGDYSVICSRTFECWCGPDCESESEAIAAWNRVMRPRPVVKVGLHAGTWGYRMCPLFGDMGFPPALLDAVKEELTAAGFDVAESEEGK